MKHLSPHIPHPTTMSTPLLAAIDIGTYVSNTQGLNPKQLSYVNHVFAPINPANVDGVPVPAADHGVIFKLL